ncbi:MAG: hypothetical protein SGI92_31330 [Bryobacteraceae bacterium]|nr:hypothetical protein [Bryobacteraceae bacterium]
MLKRFVFIVVMLLATVRAEAANYTDVYYNPAENGWGVFLVQSDTFQFLAFFIYGTDNKPTWYTAQLTQDAGDNFNGQLYATTGTYFGLPWNPAQLTVAPVGTVSFKPIDVYHATVTYALTGGPTVTKTVERQTLTAYPLAGNYSGSVSGTQSGCPNPSDNNPKFRGRYNLAVTQANSMSATLIFNFVDTANNGVVCTATGPLTAFGRLYKMSNAQFSCVEPGSPSGSPTSITIDSFHPTGQGIEGRFSGPTPDGCVVDNHFSAVRNN